ncbi:MAG: MarR family transcriptional regulator [Spirochaetales bacterium]|nr:MarR family transcriptional regulator [Spirochaetales bacterium]
MAHSKQSVIGTLSRFTHSFKKARQADLDRLGLYPGQPRLLHVLIRNEGISQRDLAERMAVAPATLSRMIGRMEKNGYLERRPDEKDHRVTRIFPTEQSASAVERLKEVNREMEEKLFAPLSPEEKEQFLEYLERMMSDTTRGEDL